jgi:hypothetical protein
MKMKTTTLLVGTLLWLSMIASGQDMPKEFKDALAHLGKNGDFKDNVLKISLPRNDLRMTIAGVETPTSFGFGGWLAMTPGENGLAVMMGDLVLLQEEVNPVMSAILDNGLEVTALHNHFFWDEPHVYFMHIHGHGLPLDLANRVKPAIDIIGKEIPPAIRQRNIEWNSSFKSGQLSTEKLSLIIGHPGERIGAVFKTTIGRNDIILKEMGAVVSTRMGLNSWASFLGSDDSAVVAGDIAMLEDEVNPVLRALRQHGLSVVAIHHHMTSARPMLIFLHYWGTGPATELASGFRAALDQLGKPRPKLEEMRHGNE